MDLPGQLRSTLESLSDQQARISAAYEAELFTYSNVPDAAQLGALCSRLLSLTVGLLALQADQLLVQPLLSRDLFVAGRHRGRSQQGGHRSRPAPGAG